MKHKTFTLILLLITAGFVAEAHPVDVRTAREAAYKFVNANAKVPIHSMEELQLATTYNIARGTAAFHVFNTPNGFVIVAADDCSTPILGYSDEGRPFDVENVPIQMQEYLQGFVEQIEYGIEHRLQADENTARQWQQVLATGQMHDNSLDDVLEKALMKKAVKIKDHKTEMVEEADIVRPTLPRSRTTRSVEPLVTALWDQGCYYNAMCPEDEGGICNHVPTGCVATAMGMIMHYWGYPAQGTGSHSYTPAGYPEQTVNFGETTYDWANMPDQLTATSTQAEIDAVSTLLWHCGVAVDMMYGTSASGATDDPIPLALANYFGYCNGAYFLWKEDDSAWLEQVKASLDRNRPLLYFGTDIQGLGGHAFVCDGYDSGDLLHFNWGWSGNGNGYFAVDALNVSGFQFNSGIHALFGIVPSSEFQLHYNIIEGGAEVTYEQPNNALPAYDSYPDTIVIPSQVTIDNVIYPVIAIGNYAFNSCTTLKYVDMPNTITSIGDYAFANDIYITEIDLPDSLRIIGDCALMALSLSTLDLPPTLTTIGRQAFSWLNYADLFLGCYNINDEYFTTLTIPRSVTSCGNGITFGSFAMDTLNWNADSCVLVHDGGIWAFGISSLNFGEHVRYIPEYMFSNNYYSSVTLPESLEYAGDYCFSGCDSLTTITIPQNVKYFGNSVFSGCSSLVTVNFNAKRCEYAPYLFERCGNLETINFGDSVRFVPGCMCVDILYTPSITSVKFGSSIDTIDYYAFMGCSNITSITLPSSIKHIERGAFGNCAQLNTVNMTSVTNPPSLGVWGPFDGNAENRKFLIPCESYESYYNAEGWYYHDGGGNTIFDYDYRIDLKAVPETEIQLTAIPNDTIQGNVVLYKNASVCDSTVVYFAKANHGYHFDHWSNGSTSNPDTLLLQTNTTVIAYFAKDQFHVDGTAAASVLFSNFEQPQNDALWTMKNEDYVNKWYINPLEGNGRSLFISNDGGQSNSYSNVDAHSFVLAYTPLHLNAGEYVCAFDWRAEGHGFDGQFSLNIGSGDCLFAFLYQGEIDSIPLFYYGGNPEWCYGYDFDNYLIHSLYYTDMFGQHVFKRNTLNINVPTEGEYNLLFYWRNGRTADMGGEQEPNGYPAAIDNVVFGTIDTTMGYVTGAETVDYLDAVTLTAVPNPGYRFVCWYDGDTNPTKDVVATDNLSCMAFFEVEPVNPLISQTSNLASGWSWYSTYIEQSGIDGLAMLENSMDTACSRIQSRTEFVDNLEYMGYHFWDGTLSAITNEQSYRIRTTSPCEAVITGQPALPENHPITVNPGWNWIGFPSAQPLSLTSALSAFAPEVNDQIKGRYNFATYLGNYGGVDYWDGMLTTLEPGQGYMYRSYATTAKTLVYQTGSKGETQVNGSTEGNVYQPASGAYAENMTVTAEVEINGSALRRAQGPESYELAVFVGDECRGSVKLKYVAPVDRYEAFLMVFGDGGEELSFVLTDGEETYWSNDRVVFSANAILGNPAEPYVIRFGSSAGTDEWANRMRVYPNPVERGERFSIGMNDAEERPVRIEMVNALGALVKSETLNQYPATLVAPATAGVYTLKIVVDDKTVVCRRLIVK